MSDKNSIVMPICFALISNVISAILFKSNIIIRPEYWVLQVTGKPAKEFKGRNDK
jgi:hypothetical protein